MNHIVAQPSSAPPSTTTTNSNKHGPKEPAYEDTTMRRSKRHLSSYATMNNSNNNPNNGMNMYNYNQQSMVSNKRELQNNKRVKLSHWFSIVACVFIVFFNNKTNSKSLINEES